MTDYSEVEILLIEDNPNDAELALRAFTKSRVTNNIVHVWDGEEALDYLFARNAYSKRRVDDVPKVILLDLKLPKVDGLEVLKQVKTDQRTKFIPVVVLTTSKEESDMVASYSLGVNSYIIKPVDFDKFIRSVNDIGLYWLLLNERPSVGAKRKEA